MKDKQQHIFVLSIILLFAAVLTYGMVRYQGEDFGLYGKEVHKMNQNWYLLNQNGDEFPITLPAKLDIPSNTEYSITTTVPDGFAEGMSIMIRTAQQSIQVFADQELIYTRGCDSTDFPGDFRGSSWNIIQIPQKYVGEKLTITLLSPYDQFSGSINEIQYGYKTNLMYLIIKSQMGQLICATLMLLIGILLFIFHGVKANSGASSVHITYLALFAIFCSFYLFGESRMLQFYTSNEFLITSLPFLSEIAFPIPLFMYIKEKWMPQHKWIAGTMQWVFTALFVITSILHFTEIADFFQTIILYHVSVFAAMAAIIIVSMIEIIKYRYKDSFVLTQALIVLILGCGVGICQLYLNTTTANIGICVQIGIIGFEVVMAIDSIQNFNQFEDELREKRYYEKLAYIDALTNGQNRNAYMERIFDLSRKNKRNQGIFYVLFDVNNLKIINDTYGHAMGDDAIKRTYQSLVKAFGRYGDCYRIGGDEFAVILDNCSDDDFDASYKAMTHEIEMNNREVNYELGVAGGYAMCEPDGELSFESLMKQADQMLYDNKNHMKHITANAV